MSSAKASDPQEAHTPSLKTRHGAQYPLTRNLLHTSQAAAKLAASA